MAAVELRFSPLPAHVRTARLVAVTLARQAGVDESLLDEVRLVVGEACSRAVGLEAHSAAPRPIRLAMDVQGKCFVIQVGGGALQGASRADAPAGEARTVVGRGRQGVDISADDDTLGLAVISGLARDLVIGHGVDGSFLRVSWPVARETDDSA